MSKWWWGSSLGRTGGLRVGVEGPRNILEVSLVVLVVIWAYSRYECTGNVRIPTPKESSNAYTFVLVFS